MEIWIQIIIKEESIEIDMSLPPKDPQEKPVNIMGEPECSTQYPHEKHHTFPVLIVQCCRRVPGKRLRSEESDPDKESISEPKDSNQVQKSQIVSLPQTFF